MEIRWAARRRERGRKISDTSKLKSIVQPLRVPIYISTNPSNVNPQELKELYSRCNHSCDRFPIVDPVDGRLQEHIDIQKLCIALSHSSVLISAFCKPQDFNIVQTKDWLGRTETSPSFSSEEVQKQKMNLMGNLFQRMMPVSPSTGQLVGFGRAISDCGLTASIYDVMVTPSLRGMGIGQMIVKRIIRILTSRDVYDIAAVCSEDERSFFERCGFRDDILGSTTMMYTRTTSNYFEGDQLVKRAGRKVLLAPPLRVYLSSLKT